MMNGDQRLRKVSQSLNQGAFYHASQLGVCNYYKHSAMVGVTCIHINVGQHIVTSINKYCHINVKHVDSFVYLHLLLPSSHRTEGDVVSLWDVDEKLEIKVDSAGNLNVGKDASVSQ